jgi:hypothetical protein
MKGVPTTGLIMLCSFVIVTGCATSNPENKSTEARSISDGTWHKDKDLQRVWLAPGFDFAGYNAVYVANTIYAAKIRDNENSIREWAIKYLRDRIASDLPTTGVLTTVYTDPGQIPPDAKILKLENTIYEYEKGGGGARYFAGVYGAGQPVIAVRGSMSANGQPVFQFEAIRKGESGTARMFGGFRSDEGIQAEDINDLSHDLADFIRRTAQHVAK